MTINITGLILKKENFREADSKIFLLTKELGLIDAMAVGAKKSRSRLAGQLEPWREVRLMFIKGNRLDKIGQAVLRDNFKIFADTGWESFWRAQIAVNLILKKAPRGLCEKNLYDLVKNFLRLNFKQGCPSQILPIFEWRAAVILGFAPQVDCCVVCQKKRETYFFALEKGGIICSNCVEKNARQVKIDGLTIKSLRFILNQAGGELKLANMPLNTIKELHQLFEKFLSFHF